MSSFFPSGSGPQTASLHCVLVQAKKSEAEQSQSVVRANRRAVMAAAQPVQAVAEPAAQQPVTQPEGAQPDQQVQAAQQAALAALAAEAAAWQQTDS